MNLVKLLFGWTIKKGKPSEGEDAKGVINFDEEDRKIYVDGVEYSPNNDLSEDEEIANLNKRVDELDAYIEGLNEQIARLEEERELMKSENESLFERIGDMVRERLAEPLTATFTNGMAALAEQYKGMEARIEEMKEMDVEHSAYINNNMKEIDQLRDHNNKLSAIVIKQQNDIEHVKELLTGFDEEKKEEPSTKVLLND